MNESIELCDLRQATTPTNPHDCAFPGCISCAAAQQKQEAGGGARAVMRAGGGVVIIGWDWLGDFERLTDSQSRSGTTSVHSEIRPGANRRVEGERDCKEEECEHAVES